MGAKYIKLVDWAKSHIIETNMKKGDKFYSEGELVEMFNVSRQTVRHAVGLLENDGLLERRQGQGTFVAKGLSTNGIKRKAIGLVIMAYMESYIYPKVLVGIESVLQQNGYTLSLAFSDYGLDGEYKALRSVLDSDVQGIILGPIRTRLYNPYTEIYKEIEERGIPLVFLDSYREGYSFPLVGMDDVLAGQMAAEHLIEAGHTQIGGIFQSDMMQGYLRHKGFINAHIASSISYAAERTIWYTREDLDVIAGAPKHMLDRLEGCTGLVCFNDLLAFRLVDRFMEAGIRVPDDISITSIDNSDMAALCKVPLTTLEHPKERLGQLAAEQMIKLINDPNYNANTLISPSLIMRDSVRKIER